MNSRKILLAAVVSLCLPMAADSYGQQLSNAEVYANIQSLRAGSMFRPFDNRHKNIKGYVTLFATYVPGIIYFDKGQVVPFDKLNYDAFEGELLAEYNERQVVAGTDMVKAFTLLAGDSLFFYRLASVDGKLGFFQKCLQTSRIGLYKRTYKTLQEAEKNQYGTERDAEFITSEKFFLRENGKPLTEFKTRKSFLQFFPENESELEQFIKREKIDFKNATDLLRLFQYLDQLLAG